MHVGVNVSMNGCMSLYVSPVMEWGLLQLGSPPTSSIPSYL